MRCSNSIITVVRKQEMRSRLEQIDQIGLKNTKKKKKVEKRVVKGRERNEMH